MKRALFALALAAALPMSAQAAELSYTYVQGGYAVDEYSDSALSNGDGYFLGGSYNFGDTGFYVAGTYSTTSVKIFSAVNIDIDRTLIGGGYHHSVADSADFVVQADYLDYNSDFGFIDANGYRVSAGFRGSITDKLEGSILAHYEHTSDFDGDTSLSVDAQYKLNETLGIIGGLEIGKRFDQDLVSYNIGLRASF